MQGQIYQKQVPICVFVPLLMNRKIVLTMHETILPTNCKHLWRGSCVRFGDIKQRCQYRQALYFSWLTLSDTLSSFYTTSTKSAIFWERPSSQESTRVFFSCFGTAYAPEVIHKCFIFLFEYENRKFHVITCSFFLNDLFILIKKTLRLSRS